MLQPQWQAGATAQLSDWLLYVPHYPHIVLTAPLPLPCLLMQCVVQLPGLQWVYTVCFSPCGKWLAAAGNETTARVWDAGNGTQVTTLQL